MSTPVTIYEDNAGGLWLRADDGTVAYEGGHDTVTDEVAFVREHPDGAPATTWTASQLPWTDDLDSQWHTIGIYADHLITDQATGLYRLDRPGIAGRAYLGLPKGAFKRLRDAGLR
jgi:hypothetical protein